MLDDSGPYTIIVCLDLQYIQNLYVFVVMTRNMFPLRMKRITLTFCFRLTHYYPTIPDQEQIVQTYSNPFSNHECLGFVMIVGNVMIYHRSLFWGNHSKIIHILHIVDGTKSCTSWGWSFIPPFTWFYTSFRWLAGFLNHQQCECTGHPTDSVAIPKPFTNPWRESCGFILVHFVASLLVATNCWMTFPGSPLTTTTFLWNTMDSPNLR